VDKDYRVEFASGTFPLDCLGSGIEVGLWIEMVITLHLSHLNEMVPPNERSSVCHAYIFVTVTKTVSMRTIW
jgi:hypothetical protein